jgi:hypothetical protein
MNRLLIAFIMIFSIELAVTIGSCGKPCHEPDHNFRIFDSFFPEKDSIKIGDTLFFTCIILKMETDIDTHVLINFSNLDNLGNNLIVSDISKFNQQRNAADSFSFFNVYGEIYSDQYSAKQLKFEESDTSYSLKVGLIALKAGRYIFTLPDAPGIYRKGHLKCGRGNFEILNSNVDKHLYLFENIWGQLSTYDSLHSYCIKVY